MRIPTCYQLTFCDANGTRKDRRNGGLYVTEDAQTSPTISTSHNEGLVIVDDEPHEIDKTDTILLAWADSTDTGASG